MNKEEKKETRIVFLKQKSMPCRKAFQAKLSAEESLICMSRDTLQQGWLLWISATKKKPSH